MIPQNEFNPAAKTMPPPAVQSLLDPAHHSMRAVPSRFVDTRGGPTLNPPPARSASATSVPQPDHPCPIPAAPQPDHLERHLSPVRLDTLRHTLATRHPVLWRSVRSFVVIFRTPPAIIPKSSAQKLTRCNTHHLSRKRTSTAGTISVAALGPQFVRTNDRQWAPVEWRAWVASHPHQHTPAQPALPHPRRFAPSAVKNSFRISNHLPHFPATPDTLGHTKTQSGWRRNPRWD